MNDASNQIMSKNIFRGAVATLLSLGVTTIIGLMIMPMVVNHLGDRLYGVWVFVGTVTGYFAFLDLGLSKAVMRFVSQSLGMNDREEADKWITLALVCFSVLAILGVFLSILIWLFAPLFLASDGNEKAISFAFLVSLLAFSFTLPARCFVGVLEAHIRKDLISLIRVVVNILRAATIFTAIYLNASLLQLVSVTAFYLIFEAIVSVILALFIHGKIKMDMSVVCRDRIKKFSDYAFSSFVTQIMDIARSKSYPLIITPFLGLAALTPFAIAERLNQMVVSICNGILLNLTPAFSQFEGQGGVTGNEKIKKAYLFSYKISCYLGVFCVGMTMLFAESFIERWMGADYLNVVPLLLVLLCGVFFAVIQIPTLCFLFAVSRHKFYAVTNTIHAFLTVGLCIVFVIYFGAIGVALGISIAMFVIKFLVQPYAMLHLLELKFVQYHMKYTFPNIAIPIIFMVGVSFIVNNILAPDYFIMFMTGLTASILFMCYIYFFGFIKIERTLILKVINPYRHFCGGAN
jgi:O-antigen/teichoic acid export membrane protein